MSDVQTLRGLINQRLSLAAEEIFELFERTIAEYEEQLCRSKEENERQHKLLEAAYNPEVRLHRADVQVQTLLVKTETVPAQQQERGPSVDQEDPPEPAHIKEEEEEVWWRQETEQLHGLKEEEESSEFTVTPVAAKNEEGGEEADEESFSFSIFRNSFREESNLFRHQIPHTGNLQHVSGLNPLQNEETPAGEKDSGINLESSADSATKSDQNNKPQNLKELQKEDRPFCCPVCKKGFSNKRNLKRHMCSHLSERPHRCSVCEKTFVQKCHLKQHMVCHSGEKPFHCSVCGKSFSLRSSLRHHSYLHSGEKPHSCSLCEKTFIKFSQLKEHAAVHTGERPFSCSLCDASFTRRGNLIKHTVVHTGEKPYRCKVCDKSFAWPDKLKKHKCDAENSVN